MSKRPLNYEPNPRRKLAPSFSEMFGIIEIARP